MNVNRTVGELDWINQVRDLQKRCLMNLYLTD